MTIFLTFSAAQHEVAGFINEMLLITLKTK